MFSSFLSRVLIICVFATSLVACNGSTSDSVSGISAIDSTTKSTDTGTGSTTPVNPTGVVTLNWTPPTENTDGSSLVDLSGYTIYYGLAPDNMNNSISITNSGLTSYVVENLAANTTYYFSIIAINSQNAASDFSNIVSKVTNTQQPA